MVLQRSCAKLDKRITGCCGDPTLVLSVFSHVDVSFVSPLLTPAAKRQKNKRNKRSGNEFNWLNVFPLLHNYRVGAVLEGLKSGIQPGTQAANKLSVYSTLVEFLPKCSSEVLHQFENCVT